MPACSGESWALAIGPNGVVALSLNRQRQTSGKPGKRPGTPACAAMPPVAHLQAARDVRAIVEGVKGGHLKEAPLDLVMRVSIAAPGEEGEPPAAPDQFGPIRLVA